MLSCPSHEVGSTESNQNDQVRDPEEGHVYLNINEAAVCSGTVYGWRYCFGPDLNRSPTRLVLAMYHQQNGSYHLVPGSRYPLTVEELPGPNFLCRSTTLQPSEYFTVQENDVVAFCEPYNTPRVEVFYERSGNSLQSWNAGGCSESQIMSSPQQLEDRNNRVFLLSALIGKS